ncbi:MAG: HD domain-containing protein [Cyanobacteria bacterium K_Offshore_surface_m2_239]|nr:HD domain-containing protein [Cyanobacteria bacterium K_Offshore_surface_m2_239]
MSPRQRTYHDPLHGAIQLDRAIPAEALAIDLIDLSPFQRLRRIRQLGPAFLTFHGAESSRFTHSLGVLHLARQALHHLERLHPQLEEQRVRLYAAALLHDVGHGPLSHSGEEMFGLSHETWSARVIREAPSVRDRLEAEGRGTAEAVAHWLSRSSADGPGIQSLVSSQLDCDRLDYLLRDSYSTGTRYGQLDLDRLLAGLVLAPDGSLAVHPRALLAVEHYLVVRQLMYRSVYNHRLNVVCNWLLKRAIAVARQLGPQQVWTDGPMADWLWRADDLSLESFLDNDDVRTLYHFSRWRDDGPAELRDPCERLLNRRLLKALDVRHLSTTQRLEALALAQREALRVGLNPDGCCALQQGQTRGYDPYRSGLRLWDGDKLQALEASSRLVQSLTTQEPWAWLLHPQEVEHTLRAKLQEPQT